jgi:hypothetical protein
MSSLVYRLGKSGGQKRSNDRDLGYYASGSTNGQRDVNKPMPYSRSLARFYRVRLKDENGKEKVHRIGYSPGENTIFIDDFVDPEAPLVKVRFKKGILVVDDEKEPQLAEFLETLDINESNKNRNKRSKVVFHRVNKNEKAEGILKKEEIIAKKLAIFWDIPITKKQAIANWVGIRTLEVAPEIWQHHLYQWAKNNVGEFNDIYHNPDVDYMDYVARAENTQVLRWNANAWYYNDVKIMVTSSSKNRYKDLVKRFLNDPQLYKAVVDTVREKEGLAPEVKEEKKYDLDVMTAEEILNAAKKEDIVDYRPGTGHFIVATGKLIGSKSTDSAIEAITKDKLIVEQLKAQFEKFVV